MSNRQLYIEKYAQYLFYKYIYKVFLENKYIEYFSEYEIKKMELIHESMIIDKELENKFIYGIHEEYNHFKFMNFLAKREYSNLQKKISRLKNKRDNFNVYLKDIRQLLNNEFLDKLKILIDKYDPFINKEQYTETAWNMIKYSIETVQFEIIFDSFSKLGDLEFSKSRLSAKDLSEKIKYFDTQMDNMTELFPFNVEDTISSKKEINKKIKEIKSEIKKSDKALKHITNMYLYVNEYNGLEN